MRTWLARGLGAVTLACLTAGLAAIPAAAVPARSQSRAAESLQPWPVTITIRTVPAMPGVRFLFDGVPLATDRQGVTSFTERHNFSSHTLALAQAEISVSGRRYTFVRWAGQRDPDQAFRPAVYGLPMRADYAVTASFAVACPVTPRLVDQDGAPMPARQVSQISLLSSLGQATTLKPAGTTWLPCVSPVYRGSLLYSHAVLYSVQSVLVGGTNVVHAGVERFSPSQTPDPKVTGFFYSLTITAHDALLGGAVGNYALLTMPDKTVRKVALGPQHTATVTGLPLGDYQVQVAAGSASISPVTVHLSRDEAANLAAISRKDIAIVCGVLIAGIAGAPLLSRTRRGQVLALVRWVFRLMRRSARATGEEVSLCCRSAADGPPRRRFCVHWPRPVWLAAP
jgi:hypothetical protein